MILKFLCDFYRWFWGLPPMDMTGEEMSLLAGFGAMIDIAILIGIVGEIIIFFSDRRAR